MLLVTKPRRRGSCFLLGEVPLFFFFLKQRKLSQTSPPADTSHLISQNCSKCSLKRSVSSNGNENSMTSLIKHKTVCVYVYAQSLSHVRLFAAPQTLACQAPLSMGFSRQEYCSGLPFPSSDPLVPTVGLAVVGRACLTLLSLLGAGLPAASGGPACRRECGAGTGASAEPGAPPGRPWGR